MKATFVLCADGHTGIKEATAVAYPLTEYQRCIVHVVRNTLQYVAEKDKKVFANDLKALYLATFELTIEKDDALSKLGRGLR